MRLRVQDVLELLSSGMIYEEILADYDELERDDILAVLEFAAHLKSGPPRPTHQGIPGVTLADAEITRIADAQDWAVVTKDEDLRMLVHDPQ